MRSVLRYNAKRAYFGQFVPQDMYDSYKKFKQTEKWTDPVTQDIVHIGYIDGIEICRVLWHQASYNPKRFGNESPFIYNGREDIRMFCEYGVPKDFPAYEIWDEVRKLMIEFMELNGDPNYEDGGVIDTNRGLVRIKLTDGGFTNINYKKLSKLREMLRKIISQNLQDVNRKAYYEEILKVMLVRHPEKFAFIEEQPIKTKTKPVAVRGVIANVVDEYEESSDEGEQERIQYEIDEIWRKTNKNLSVEDFKKMELAQQAKRFAMHEMEILKQQSKVR